MYPAEVKSDGTVYCRLCGPGQPATYSFGVFYCPNTKKELDITDSQVELANIPTPDYTEDTVSTTPKKTFEVPARMPKAWDKEDSFMRSRNADNLSEAADLINGGMVWEYTPEGHSFWQFVHERLIDLARHEKKEIKAGSTVIYLGPDLDTPGAGKINVFASATTRYNVRDVRESEGIKFAFCVPAGDLQPVGVWLPVEDLELV